MLITLSGILPRIRDAVGSCRYDPIQNRPDNLKLRRFPPETLPGQRILNCEVLDHPGFSVQYDPNCLPGSLEKLVAVDRLAKPVSSTTGWLMDTLTTFNFVSFPFNSSSNCCISLMQGGHSVNQKSMSVNSEFEKFNVT